MHNQQLRDLTAHLTVHCPRFVEYMEQRLPADGGSGMSQVFDSLVEKFLDVERYANDIRYVNHCIKCVSMTKTSH